MLNKLKKNNKGFTIIEVMIVLAIAGLILLIVFLAVPALQRNQRNTQRKNDAAHLAALISEYQSNNNGRSPANVTFTGTPGANDLNATTENFSILVTTANLAVSARPTAPAVPTPDNAVVYSNAICNGTTTAAGTSTRQIVVFYGLEGGTTSGCIQD